jgi:3-oxoacyl-[acyl-carrier protein] reductase
MVEMNLFGKVAVVTGASRGIGRAIALKLAAAGAAVVVHYGARADAADAVVGEIVAAGGQAVAFGADLADVVAVRSVWQRLDPVLAAHFGLPRDTLGLATASFATIRQVRVLVVVQTSFGMPRC